MTFYKKKDNIIFVFFLVGSKINLWGVRRAGRPSSRLTLVAHALARDRSPKPPIPEPDYPPEMVGLGNMEQGRLRRRCDV